jgi:hypothetical protein
MEGWQGLDSASLTQREAGKTASLVLPEGP